MRDSAGVNVATLPSGVLPVIGSARRRDGSVLTPDLAGVRTEQGAADHIADVLRRQTDATRLRLIHAHQELGRRLAHPVVQVRQPRDAVEARFQPARIGFERVQPFPEQFDLDRPRGAREVIDDVRKNLHELDVQPRHGFGDFVAHIVHDGENVP